MEPVGKEFICVECHMGLSENWGTLFRCPYNKDPTIWGAIVGSPIFGNLHIKAAKPWTSDPVSAPRRKSKAVSSSDQTCARR